MKNLVIDRKIWLRGEDPETSRLFRKEDKKMCCLGIYLNKCRVSKKNLLDIQSPMSVNVSLPNQAKWLTNPSGDNSDLADTLMKRNDNRHITPKRREADIVAGFAKAGVKVKFKN
jgi:hypothetical protein